MEAKKYEKKLEVLITSGGTISKIDDVRHIGNFSNGTTGALIAEEFLRNGWKVHYLYSQNAVRPFRRDLELDPLKDYEKEEKRIKEVYEEFNKYKNSLGEQSFLTFDDYYKAVYNSLNYGKIDAVVLAAAVSDYGVEKQEGKISSEQEELVIKLKRNPKVISKIKEWKKDVFLVGFKLLSGINDNELIEIAYKHGLKNKSDLTVANSFGGGMLRMSSTYLIYPEKEAIPVKRYELAGRLVKEVNKRISNWSKNG